MGSHGYFRVAMTSVSVVIPCYNYGHFLRDAISSALDDQPGSDARVLVIDDASTDDSAEVARNGKKPAPSTDPPVSRIMTPLNV